MATTIREILSGANLIGVIQKTKSGIPEGLLPPAFLATRKTTLGNAGHYIRVDGNRQTARLVTYGSPSVRREQKGVSRIPVNLLHTFEHQMHEPIVLQHLLSVNGGEQQLGRDEIARQVGAFRKLFDNLRLAAIYSLLFQGAIHFDGDGNLLPNSTGAFITVDFGIPAGNKNQLNVGAWGAIISASWATAATDIIAQLVALKQAAIKLTGYPVVNAFYGANVMGYLTANDTIKALISGSAGMSEQAAAGNVPRGLCGFNWYPCFEAIYLDQDGAAQVMCGADTVVFTPAVDASWYEMLEGTFAVPTNLGNVGADAVASLGNLRVVQGMFSYAKITDDPANIKHMAGDTFLPVMKVPKAVFIGDVTP